MGAALGAVQSVTDVPNFGDAYYRARKALGLTSGLLLAWALIGIEVPAAPFEGINITLKSPEAAPYVLIALIVYFWFRTWIEWHQTATVRRQRWPSLVDFIAATSIAATALVIYGFQIARGLQVADQIQPVLIVPALLMGALFGSVAANVAAIIFRRRPAADFRSQFLILLFGPSVVLALLSPIYPLYPLTPQCVVSLGIGIGITLLALVWFLRRVARKLARPHPLPAGTL